MLCLRYLTHLVNNLYTAPLCPVSSLSLLAIVVPNVVCVLLVELLTRRPAVTITHTVVHAQ